MPAELIEIHPKNPESRKISEVIAILNKGGVIIYPTDTVYAIGCALNQPKAIERICKIKNLKPEKLNLAFICNDMSHISTYVHNLPTHIFKEMKALLPGPYAFILNATGEVPKILGVKKKTVGIRIPNHSIPRTLVFQLGVPLVTTSIKSDLEVQSYTTDAIEIYNDYKYIVDIVIDGGIGGNVPSTVLDCTKDNILILRKGLGKY